MIGAIINPIINSKNNIGDNIIKGGNKNKKITIPIIINNDINGGNINHNNIFFLDISSIIIIEYIYFIIILIKLKIIILISKII